MARDKIAKDLNLIDEDSCFCWIVDYAMFELDKKKQKKLIPATLQLQGDLKNLDLSEASRN